MADTPQVSYAPTEELDLIRSTARQFLGDRYPSDAVRKLMATDDGYDRGLWQELVDLGWVGLSIDEEAGGAGLGGVEMATMLEEMGRHVMPGPFFGSAVLATHAVMSISEGEERKSMLERLASGSAIASLAIFETARGWDPGAPSTVAHQVDGVWRLSGEKRYVLDGHTADVILVVAADGVEIALFGVEAGASGLTVTQTPAMDQTRRQAVVGLEGVEAIRLGEGDVTDRLRQTLAYGSAMLANESVGGAAAAMEMAVEYAKTRHQFGRPIGSYQAIKHRCANMLLKLEHAKSAAYHAARVIDDPAEFAIAAPLAASVTSEAFTWIAGENIQVHGGVGFTWEHDAHLYLKRAKSSSLLLGSPTFQRNLLGRAVGV